MDPKCHMFLRRPACLEPHKAFPTSSLALPKPLPMTAAAYQAVEPRVSGVHMGPQELETQEAREGENASHGCLCRAVRIDEYQHSRQKNPPAALDHLKVVQGRAWVRTSRGHKVSSWFRRASTYQSGIPEPKFPAEGLCIIRL